MAYWTSSQVPTLLRSEATSVFPNLFLFYCKWFHFAFHIQWTLKLTTQRYLTWDRGDIFTLTESSAQLEMGSWCRKSESSWVLMVVGGGMTWTNCCHCAVHRPLPWWCILPARSLLILLATIGRTCNWWLYGVLSLCLYFYPLNLLG